MTPETTLDNAAPANFFSRLMGVYFSPGETFKEIGRKPTFIAPLLTLMLLGGLSTFALIDRITVPKFFGQGFEQAVAKGQMSQEDANKQLDAMSIRATWIKAGFFGAGLIQSGIITLILAGIFKLISMVMGTENQFKAVYSVTVYAMLAVSLISIVVFITTLYLKPLDEIEIENLSMSNLGAWLTLLVGKDGLPKFIMSFARWIDVFAIWIIALLSIGYAAVSRKLKTSSVAFALGGLYLVAALITAVVSAFRG
jgi:hypothetical protein